MAKQTLTDRLARLDALGADPSAPDAQQQLRAAVQSKTSHVIARAAEIIGEAELAAFEPVLAERFRALLDAPAAADKGCNAKTALAKALYRLGHADEEVFLPGIRLVQLEPVWGGQEDVAAELRCLCALVLVRMNYPAVMAELADLLADPQWPARLGAVDAIVYRGHDDAVPLLRYKVHVGDDEPQVVQACLAGLLSLQADQQIGFVGSLLDDPRDAVPEAAALALGESRRPEALDLLKNWLERIIEPSLREMALLAIAMLRSDEAIAFLLSELRTGPASVAPSVVTALAIYRDNPAVAEQVWRIVRDRQDSTLAATCAEAFGERESS